MERGRGGRERGVLTIWGYVDRGSRVVEVGLEQWVHLASGDGNGAVDRVASVVGPDRISQLLRVAGGGVSRGEDTEDEQGQKSTQPISAILRTGLLLQLAGVDQLGEEGGADLGRDGGDDGPSRLGCICVRGIGVDECLCN